MEEEFDKKNRLR